MNSATLRLQCLTRATRQTVAPLTVYSVPPGEFCAMADAKSFLHQDSFTMMSTSGWPAPSLYAFSFQDVAALFGQLGLAMMSVLPSRRRSARVARGAKSDLAVPPAGLTAPPSGGQRSRAYPSPNISNTFHFRLLHIVSFLVVLPAIAATRLLPSHWRQPHDQSVFVETNYAVLTALGLAFTA